MKLVLFFLIAFVGQAFPAQPLFLSPDRAVSYTEYKSSEPTSKTILIFNGLVYRAEYWKAFAEKLAEKNYRIILYSYSAHPESLIHLQERPFYEESETFWGWPAERGVELEELADEAARVLDHLGVREPVTVLSLSYGSFPATAFVTKYSQRVSHLVYAAPAIRPSQSYEPLLNLTGWNSYFQQGRTNDLIDYQYKSWMRQSMQSLMSSKYEQLGEDYLPPGLDFETFFRSVYHLARAARYADLKEMVAETDVEISLWLAGQEESQLLEDQLGLWNIISSRAQLLLFEGAYHAMPGAHPDASVEIIDELLGDFRPSSRKKAREGDRGISYFPW